jgi:3-methyladenine DNA glycosylase/8-oxoguanine DNA glycosylase
VQRATRTPDGPGTAAYRDCGGRIEVRAWGPGASWLLEHAPDVLGFSDNPDDFRPSEPLLRDLARRHPGLRFGRSDAIVEALVPSILEQKVPGKEAFRAYELLVKRYGEPAPGPLGLMLQPAPATIAALPYWTLHPFGVEQRRALTLIRAAGRAKRLEEAVAMTTAEAERRLRALPGIGPWTAAEAIRSALGDPDAVSVGDFHLPHLVSWALAGEPRSDDARMLELLEPYRGHRARAIRLLELSGIGAPRFGPRMRLRSIAAI